MDQPHCKTVNKQTAVLTLVSVRARNRGATLHTTSTVAKQTHPTTPKRTDLFWYHCPMN